MDLLGGSGVPHRSNRDPEKILKTRVGISGWTYPAWRRTFYPKGLPHSRELEFASRELSSIEINGTFYSLQKPTSFKHWYESTPEDFIFSVKANKFISHVKKLHEVEIPLANFFSSGLLNLKEKLGPILWQFPESMSFDPDRWESFLSLLPHDFKGAAKLAKKHDIDSDRTEFKFQENHRIRHAVEVRSHSFLNPWFLELLRKFNVALVFADTAGKWPYMEDVTSDFIYIRLHGDSELYVSGYDESSIKLWAQRIKVWMKGSEPKNRLTLVEETSRSRGRDVFIYFDNDAKVLSPRDASRLTKLLDTV